MIHLQRDGWLCRACSHKRWFTLTSSSNVSNERQRFFCRDVPSANSAQVQSLDQKSTHFFAARLRPARPHGSTGYFFLTPASRHNFKILSHASAASKSGGLCPGEGSTFGKVNPCKILVKFELQSVADLATPTEKQGYQDRLRDNFVNDSNPTKRFKWNPSSRLRSFGSFHFLTLCQTHPQNVGDGDVRGASNHDLEDSKKCTKKHKTARVRRKRKQSSVSLVSSVVCFFTIFRIFCTNPQCLDRLPAHWLPVLPSTGFVANLDGSKKKTVDPKQLQKSHFGIYFQLSLCWLEDKVGDKLGHKRRGRQKTGDTASQTRWKTKWKTRPETGLETSPGRRTQHPRQGGCTKKALRTLSSKLFGEKCEWKRCLRFNFYQLIIQSLKFLLHMVSTSPYNIHSSLMSGSRPHQNCTSGSWCNGCLCRSAGPPKIHLERGTSRWKIQRKSHKFPQFSTFQRSDPSRFDSLEGAKLTDIPQTKAFASRKSQIKSKRWRRPTMSYVMVISVFFPIMRLCLLSVCKLCLSVLVSKVWCLQLALFPQIEGAHFEWQQSPIQEGKGKMHNEGL